MILLGLNGKELTDMGKYEYPKAVSIIAFWSLVDNIFILKYNLMLAFSLRLCTFHHCYPMILPKYKM